MAKWPLERSRLTNNQQQDHNMLTELALNDSSVTHQQIVLSSLQEIKVYLLGRVHSLELQNIPDYFFLH